MWRKRSVCALVVLLLASSSLSAAVIPGRWEKVALEKSGSHLLVSLKTGERIDARFKRLTEDAIILKPLEGGDRTIPKTAVARIVTADKRSGDLKKGAQIGAAVGGGIPAVTGLIVCVTNHDSGRYAGAVIGVSLVGAGVGALAGVGVAAAIRGRVTLYEAIGESEK